MPFFRASRRVELRVGVEYRRRKPLPDRLKSVFLRGTKIAPGLPLGATPMTERMCNEFKVPLPINFRNQRGIHACTAVTGSDLARLLELRPSSTFSTCSARWA